MRKTSIIQKVINCLLISMFVIQSTYSFVDSPGIPISSLSRNENIENLKIKEVDFDALYNVIKTTKFLDNGVVITEQRKYDAVNNMIERIDPNSKCWTYKFDELNRSVKEIRPDGSEAIQKYDGRNNVVEVKDYVGTSYYTVFDELNRKIQETVKLNGQDLNTIYQYDSNSNLTHVVDRNRNLYETVFDKMNRKIKEILPEVECVVGNAGLSKIRPEIKYEYFKNGLLKSVTDSNGLKSSYEYDVLKRKIADIDNRSKQAVYSYDAVGNMTAKVDRNSIRSEYVFDDLNRMIKTIEDVGGINKVTQFEFDNVGNKTKMTDSNGVVTGFSYDMANRLIEHKLPNGHSYTFKYDGNSNITEKLTPNGGRILQNFDDLNRLIKKQTQDTRPQTFEFRYDANSNVTFAMNGHAILDNTFDGLNRLIKTSAKYSCVTGTTRYVNYGYDDNSNLTQMTYPSGKIVDYGFDGLNRLKEIKNVELKIKNEYDSGSRLVGQTLGNGIAVKNNFDNLNRLLSSTSSLGLTAGANILNLQYNYNNENCKLFERISHVIASSSEAISKADHFKYDNLYRVTGTKYGVQSALTAGTISEANQPTAPLYSEVASEAKKQEFNLDKEHNRINQSVIANASEAISTSYSVNAMNQYTNISVIPAQAGIQISPTYDNNGNLISDAVHKYVYDAENRLLEVRKFSNDDLIASYFYDPMGRRIAKKVFSLGSVVISLSYLDNAWNLLEEYTKTGTNAEQLAREYTYSGTDRLVTATANLNVLGIDPSVIARSPSDVAISYYFHQNSLGNVLALTDSAGSVICRYSYSIDGNCTLLDKDGNVLANVNDVIARSASDVAISLFKLNEKLWEGRELDFESMLYCFRNRQYSPELGRFISTDPMLYTDSMNLYAMCNGNVTNLTDPMGTLSLPKHREAASKSLEKALAKGTFHLPKGCSAGEFTYYLKQGSMLPDIQYKSWAKFLYNPLSRFSDWATPEFMEELGEDIGNLNKGFGDWKDEQIEDCLPQLWTFICWWRDNDAKPKAIELLAPYFSKGVKWAQKKYQDNKFMNKYLKLNSWESDLQNIMIARTHLFDLQWQHGMGEDSKAVVQNIIEDTGFRIKSFKQLIANGDFQGAAHHLGIILHYLEDTWTPSHTARDESGNIIQAFNYTAQSPALHAKMDDPNSDSYQMHRAIIKGTRLLELIDKYGDDPITIRDKLKNEIYALNEDPNYKNTAYDIRRGQQDAINAVNRPLGWFGTDVNSIINSAMPYVNKGISMLKGNGSSKNET